MNTNLVTLYQKKDEWFTNKAKAGKGKVVVHPVGTLREKPESIPAWAWGWKGLEHLPH